MKVAFLIAGILLSLSGSAQPKISNPVVDHDFPDPAVLNAGGKYYAYATNSRATGYKHIQLAISTDLVHWKDTTDALPRGAVWARGDFWAPHVLFDKQNNQYVMFYSAQSVNNTLGKCLGVAFSDKPEGPFIDMGKPFLEGKSFVNIDPFAFVDPDSGKKLLYWGSAHQPIHVQELSDDWKSFKSGSAKQVVVRPSSGAGYDKLIEGAWVDRVNGYYYIYYSGDNCCGPQAHYAVMVARSQNALGPYETPGQANGSSSVILEKDNNWVAPGHNSIFRDQKGNTFIAYHAIAADRKRSGRVMLIRRIEYKNGWPVVIDDE